MSDLLPVYFGLLTAAREASEAVDDYDLHSDDPQSVEVFNELLRFQESTSRRLIKFAHEHRSELLLELERL